MKVEIEEAKKFFGIKDENWVTMTQEEKQSYADEIIDTPAFRRAFRDGVRS